MKNNKPLIIIAIILLNVIVAFMVGQTLLGKASGNEIKIAEAREYAQQDLCSKAIASYNEAINAKDTVELRLETIDVLKRGLEIGEFTNAYDVTNQILAAVEAHSESPELYEAACKVFIEREDYEQCAELLKKAKAYKVSSEKLDEYLEQVRYQYYKCFAMYNEVMPEYDGLYTVVTNGAYAFLNSEASPTLKGGYLSASGFSYGYALVKAQASDGTITSFVINKKSERQTYFKDVAASTGVGKAKDAEGNDILLIACQKVADTYKYYDLKGNEVFGDYLYAGRFRNNIAAVTEKDGTWKLINGAGEQLGGKTFSDVILNEYGECAARGLIFAKSGDRYHLYSYKDISQIGDCSFEDAKAFWGDLAAVKQDGLWGFADAEGNIVIEPQFEDAKSFSNGVGAVLSGGTWSLIASDGHIIPSEGFEDVLYLSESGILFVKSKGYWSYLKFYYSGK